MGAWSFIGDAKDVTNLEEAVKAQADTTNMSFHAGSPMLGSDIRLEGFGEAMEQSHTPEEEEAMLLEAVNAAKEAEVVVLAIGEDRLQSGEATSNADIRIPEIQQRLLERVSKVNENVVVVLFNGRPLDLRRASEQADALLMAWYPGARGGDAVAETILGRNNPAGRLPITIPRAEGQIPVYYNKKRPANHDYTDLTAAPLYPFGYGLSYSTFEYGSLEARQSGDNVLEVSCRIRNTSDREGDEVVQLYISDMVAATVRPPRQLGGFRRIRLAPGEQRQVSFTLGDEALALIDPQGRRVVEKGDFVIAVGSSSQDIRLQTTVTLE